VRNKPLVSRVVLLLVPGVDFARCAESSARLMPNVRAALGRGVPTAFDNPTANEFNVARALLCSVHGGVGAQQGGGKGAGKGGGGGKKRDLKSAPSSVKGAPGGGGGIDARRPYGSTAAADLCRREMPLPPSHYVLSAADMADMEYPIPTLGAAAEAAHTAATAGDGDEGKDTWYTLPGNAAEDDGAGGGGSGGNCGDGVAGEDGGGGGDGGANGDAGRGGEGAEKGGGGGGGGRAAAGEASELRLVVPEGYVVTQPSGGGIARNPHLSMVAIDCEMCYTVGMRTRDSNMSTLNLKS
jgi:RNA exonuclease 1